MRITAGHLRGRHVPVPAAPGIRPTPARVREALFNILGDMDECAVLDLFSGSGIMALEALSRGARPVCSVDASSAAIRAMQTVRRTWGLGEDWRIERGRLPAALARLQGLRVDVIFADPPYQTGLAEQLPAWLDAHDIACRVLVIEESVRAGLRWPADWTETRTRRYGDTCLHFLARKEPV